MIHPTASISGECVMGEGVEIGPYCVLAGRITLGAGVRLVGSVYLNGPLTIGEGTVVYPFSSVGFPGQDFKFKIGDPTAGVVIGRDSILRENTTVHAATKIDKPTVVGDNVLMMCGSHVGHDAFVDSRAIMVNCASLGGHSYLGKSATLSAYSGIHQFGRIGRLAFVSGCIPVTLDVPPFCLVTKREGMAGLNLVGLRRSGMARDLITSLRSAYRDVFRRFLTRQDMLDVLKDWTQTCPPVSEWLAFITDKNRAISTGYRGYAAEPVLES